MTTLSLEALIAAVNAAGYNVYLHQYDKRTHPGETRWEACATSAHRDQPMKSHIYMDEICFGRDARHALGKLLDKCQAAPIAAKKPSVDSLFDEDEPEVDPFD